jgi:cytochrome c oxidase subunit 2|tara:strand:- start:330 stop:707 length:378 start_codon:yes stop_codon:yes gene_type:complete
MSHKKIFLALAISLAIWLVLSFTGGITGFSSSSSGDVKEFDVVSSQFRFEHDISANVGDTLRLKVTSSDVAHGFYLPDYGINEQILPGQTTIIEFKVTKPGQVLFACSVMCGAGHGSMRGSFTVN